MSTRRLVGSSEEQEVLEGLLERSKPPVPPDYSELHGALYAPFRYPPLRHGSRFGRRSERGIWYGSLAVETALAEVAYYQLLFFEHTEASIPPLQVGLAAYQARVDTERGADLVVAPFSGFRGELASPVHYEAAQATGAAMRADGVEAFTAPSARDPDGGPNVGVIEPRALAKTTLDTVVPWYAWASRQAVEYRTAPLVAAAERLLRFDRSVFEVDGVLPQPVA